MSCLKQCFSTRRWKTVKGNKDMTKGEKEKKRKEKKSKARV
jgi:hypothetical protein